MKITLLKFGAVWCGPCVALSKAKTLEKFARAHPEVEVQKHDDTEKGSDKWSELADENGVKSMPTLVWKAGGKVLFRSSDVRAEAIEKQLLRAQKLAGGA